MTSLILPNVTRRGFIIGLSATVAAPTIIRAESLMPIKVFDRLYTRAMVEYVADFDQYAVQVDRSWRKLPMPIGAQSIPMEVLEKIVSPRELADLIPPNNGQRHIGVGVSRQQWELLWHVTSRG